LSVLGRTAIAWNGAAPDSVGAFAFLDDDVGTDAGALDTTASVYGPYWFIDVPGASTLGRFVYTGLSALGASAIAKNGLYVADQCASAPASTSLAFGPSDQCGAPMLVSAWGDTSGPVAFDRLGNAVAVAATIADERQEARSFLASEIARGAPATTGHSMFTINGYPGGLVAIAPSGLTDASAEALGHAYFQPFDGASFTALDVVVAPYAVDATPLPASTPTRFLKNATITSHAFGLMVDDRDRIWVSASDAASTTYVVLAR
jgi:hypothetical protein